MKIYLNKYTDKLIGALRVTEKVYAKVEAISKKEKVSKQEVIRAILDQVIDQIDE